MNTRKHSKLISIILSITLLLSISLSVSANQPISVYMNNEKINFDVEPMLVNGRTMVPMRAIFEKLGAEVSWDNATNTATAFKDTTYVSITIGSLFMNTFLEPIKLDAPAMIVDGRTLIPLRAVSEAFNCEVKWDGSTSTVNIYSDDYIDYTQQSTSQTTVNVATPTELLNAIGSNKRIVLTSNYYNLSDLPPVNNQYVDKQLNYDETYLDSYIIKNVVNMTIEGNAEIAINDKMADVLSFEKCGKITLSGLTIGHTTSYDEYQCEGSVVRFTICDNINVNSCNLYGCGAVGIYADNVKNLNVSGGKIYDCTYTGIWLTDNSNATVKKTEFFDSVHSSGFIRIDNSTINCTDCNVRNIVCSDWAEGFIETFDWVDEPSKITFTNCVFSNNTFKKITNGETKHLAFNNCTFNNNVGDMQHPNVVYNNNGSAGSSVSNQVTSSSATKTMYAPDGRTIVVDYSEVGAYKNVGWYVEPVVLMYAADGRTLYVGQSEVEAYKNVGWYGEPVQTMYAADGRTLVVNKSEVEAHKKVGWYESQKDAVASNYPKHNIKIYDVFINDIDSVGGVEPCIRWRNDSGKTIKYIYFTVTPYNSVGDAISCRISGDCTVRLKSTGPYNPFNPYNLGYLAVMPYNGGSSDVFTKDDRYYAWESWDNNKDNLYYLSDNDMKYVYDNYCSWNPIWYNNTARSIYLSKVFVEYMDGTSETISNPPIWENIFRNAGL